MAKTKKTDRSIGALIYAGLGAVVPSCGTALSLVEQGQQRPLKLHEKFVLVYNSPLCLHCNCKREKFDKERAKMREIAANR